MKTYLFQVELEQEDNGRWSAWIETLPGCAAWSYSKEEALEAIKDTAQAFLEVLIEKGQPISCRQSGRDHGGAGCCRRPMTDDLGQLVHLLCNTPVRELIAALRRDGFSLERQTRTGGRIYSHPDGRLTSIHYHSGSDTLTRKTLCSVLQATRWTEDDLRRLGFFP